jgi:hypothetical protein
MLLVVVVCDVVVCKLLSWADTMQVENSCYDMQGFSIVFICMHMVSYCAMLF